MKVYTNIFLMYEGTCYPNTAYVSLSD